MNSSTLTELAKREKTTLNIVLKHDTELRYTMEIDGEKLLTRRGTPRIFRLNSASDYLKSLGITKFTVQN